MEALSWRWCAPLIAAIRKQRQVDLLSSRTAREIYRETYIEKTKRKKKDKICKMEYNILL